MSDLPEPLEELLGWAASEASRPRPRVREVLGICDAWMDMRQHLPDSRRTQDVSEAVDFALAMGVDNSRPVFEALAKFGIWYEGYLFAQVEAHGC